MLVTLIPVLIAAALFGHAALAQSPDQHSFGFKFAGSTVVDVVQCGMIPLATIPINTTVSYYGVPPYTVLAFEAGGISDRQDGGSNASSIPWQVRHAPGARLWLTIIDSNGDFAGFPTHYITVLAGTTDSCMPKLPDNLPRITANISETTLNTCQEWGMTISGGSPPYSVQIIAEDSPIYTNVTSPDTESDRFTYANRADPGRYMIVAVSDTTGNFGYSSRPVLTQGDANTTCVGINSSWRRSAVVEAEIEAAREAEKKRKATQKQITIAAAVVSVVGFILLCVLSFLLWRRVVKSKSGVRKGQPGFDMEPVAAFFPPAPLSQHGQFDTPLATAQMSQIGGEISPFTSQQQLVRQPSIGSNMFSAASSYSRRDELPPLPTHDFDPYPLPSGPASTPAGRKAAEAAAERRAARNPSVSGHSHSYSASMAGHSSYSNAAYYHHVASHSVGAVPLRRVPSSAGNSGGASQSAPSVVGTDDDGALIVQHRDAGLPHPIVELPPMYDPGSYRRPPSGIPAPMHPASDKQR